MGEFRLYECTLTELPDKDCMVLRHGPTKLSVQFDPRVGEEEYFFAIANLRKAVESHEQS